MKRSRVHWSPRRFLLLSLACAALSSCKKPKNEAPEGPLAVNVVTAIQKDVIEWSEFTGRMEAVDSVEVRPQISGYITEIRFKAGDIVKKDDPLFQIDPRPYQAELDRATANLDQTRAQEKLADLDFKRAETLRQKQATAAEEFDKKAATLAQAHATTRAAEATKETAALNVGFTLIKSPIAGQTGVARFTVGNLVQSDSVLTTVVSVDPLYVYADADENAVLKFMKQHADGAKDPFRNEGIPAFVQLGNEKNFPHEGSLDFVDNRLDPTTGTLRIRGVFKSWHPLLAPGFFVRMRIPSGPPQPAVLIPDKVVNSEQGVNYVYVVKPDNTIERRNLELGQLDDGLRIVRSGLKAGEKVVSTRLQMLRPGMVVRPIPET